MTTSHSTFSIPATNEKSGTPTTFQQLRRVAWLLNGRHGADAVVQAHYLLNAKVQHCPLKTASARPITRQTHHEEHRDCETVDREAAYHQH